MTQRVATDRIGVYGGTFNPIHLGHLHAARQIAEILDLSRVIFVPCAEPPHKALAGTDPIAPASQRLEWVERAVASNPLFAVDAIEVERGGCSYSIETLSVLVERLAPARLVFIVGHDAFVEMGSWREPEKIFALVDIAVTSRPPVRTGSLAGWLPECVRDDFELAHDGLSAHHRGAGTNIRLVEIDALDISASEIRARIRSGRPVSELLPESLIAGIEASGVYAGPVVTGSHDAAAGSGQEARYRRCT
jgi:nicotinate-nucleotide adenylyltransferase